MLLPTESFNFISFHSFISIYFTWFNLLYSFRLFYAFIHSFIHPSIHSFIPSVRPSVSQSVNSLTYSMLSISISCHTNFLTIFLLYLYFRSIAFPFESHFSPGHSIHCICSYIILLFQDTSSNLLNFESANFCTICKILQNKNRQNPLNFAKNSQICKI